MQSGNLLRAGLGLSILAGIVFSYPLGLNILLYVLCVLVVGVVLLIGANREIVTINSVFVLPAIFFAGMLMVNTGGVLNTVNYSLMIGSLMVVIFFHDDPRLLGGGWRSLLVTIYYALSMDWLSSPFILIRDSTGSIGKTLAESSSTPFASVVRGFTLSIPIVLVAGGLLNSADLVFSRQVEFLVGWIAAPHWTTVMVSIMISVVFFWITVASYRVLFWETDNVLAEIEQSRRRKGFFRLRLGRIELTINAIAQWITQRIQRLLRLSIIESGIITGSVMLLFLGLVVVEFGYFFGGKSNIMVDAYTYSSYARRGFFELVAATAVTVILVSALDTMTYRITERENQIFRILTSLFVMASGPLFISAFLRILLYESVYGLTQARLIGLMFIIWLSVVMVLLIFKIWMAQSNIFQVGIIGSGLLFIMILNVMTPEAVIARRNIAHFQQGAELDSVYLVSLADEAVPVLVDFSKELEPTNVHRVRIVSHLTDRLEVLDREQEQRGIIGYHFGESRAWKALDENRDLFTN